MELRTSNPAYESVRRRLKKALERVKTEVEGLRWHSTPS